MELSHRKASAKLRFLRPDGTPLANCPVSLDQTGHSFLFGCGIFDSVQLFRESSEEKQDIIRKRIDKWLKLFNYGTLPFYWGRYEPEEGKTAKEETLQAAHYLRDRGVTLKGHPLCWHTACAPWLLKYSNEEIAAAVGKVFDCRPNSIIRQLELQKPQYYGLAAYGHLGREELGVKWEQTDKTQALLDAIANA